MAPHRHEHGGFSTQGSFDPLNMFEEIGLKRGQKVLDAGCGDGYLSMIASRFVGDEGKVYSFDIHENSIMILKKRIEHGKFKNIEADVKDLLGPLPVENGSIDLILFSNVFHGFVYNGESEKIVDMIDEKLGKEGRLAMVEFRKEQTPNGPSIEERISPKDLMKMMERIHMELSMTKNISDNHYFALFERLTG